VAKFDPDAQLTESGGSSEGVFGAIVVHGSPYGRLPFILLRGA